MHQLLGYLTVLCPSKVFRYTILFFLQSQTHSEGEEQQAIIAICVQLFIFIKLIATHNMHTHTHMLSRGGDS